VISKISISHSVTEVIGVYVTTGAVLTIVVTSNDADLSIIVCVQDSFVLKFVELSILVSTTSQSTTNHATFVHAPQLILYSTLHVTLIGAFTQDGREAVTDSSAITLSQRLDHITSVKLN